MKRFLFLEILDPEVHALINGLRREFGQKESSSNLHITVRGPYTKPIPQKSIERFQRIMSDDILLIHGVGVFKNEDTYVVYIKINSDTLKGIWWKPDYPIKDYGFNPHISLYIGDDKELANAIYEFLRAEDLKLLCREFQLAPYVSKQEQMFEDRKIPEQRHFFKLANRRLVKPNILQRAANLVGSYYKKRHKNSVDHTL